jgi:hypothetical protein
VQFEMTSDVRHEFVDGHLFVMAGGSRRHSFIAVRYEQLAGEKTLHFSSLDFGLVLSELYQNLPSEEML